MLVPWRVFLGVKSPTDPITFDPNGTIQTLGSKSPRRRKRTISGLVNREPYDGLRFITIPYQNQNLETGQ